MRASSEQATRQIHGQELWADVSADVAMLRDAAAIEEALSDGATALGSVVLSRHCQRFEPSGLTAVAIIGESHLLASTYEELGLLAVNIQTCSADMNLVAGLEAICRRLVVTEVRSLAVIRRLDMPMRVVLRAESVPYRQGRLLLDQADVEPTEFGDHATGFSAKAAIR